MTSSKYFYLEHISLAIVFMLVNATTIKQSTAILAFMQDEEQLSYKCAWLLIYRSEIIGACVRQPGYMWDKFAQPAQKYIL